MKTVQAHELLWPDKLKTAEQHLLPVCILSVCSHLNQCFVIVQTYLNPLRAFGKFTVGSCF